MGASGVKPLEFQTETLSAHFPIGRGYRADMLPSAPLAGRAELRQSFRAKGDRELPRRSV
jgi:hypothetical protein